MVEHDDEIILQMAIVEGFSKNKRERLNGLLINVRNNQMRNLQI